MSEINDTKTIAPDDADSSELPTCRCGFDRNHYRVSRNGQYTLTGWFLLTCGISVTPTKVEWQCRICNQTFDASTDPAILAKRA